MQSIPRGSDAERAGASSRSLADPLLLTKLSVPFTRTSLVPRPRLRELLSDGLGRKLTLVSAPAGFGKTTLVSAGLRAGSVGGALLGWLSLEVADNDPARFWRYAISALNGAHDGLGGRALALLETPESPPIEVVLTTLLNDLATLSHELVFVLDDYHLIDAKPVHEAVSFLLDHLPSHVHLIVITRADPPLPLSRLRVRNEMTEVRASDLRFLPEEAALFFHQVMDLQLTTEAIADLDARTEGWIAGLQMAALAMRDCADIPGFIAAFAGSHRYVVDYLAEEVLERQTESVRTFLLQTSILDRMCGSLCDAVTLRDDGRRRLEQLERSNLFLGVLDDARVWYRYHHLFADVLRQHLRQTHPDLIPELHRRASVWFEQNELDTDAMKHALTGADWERAAALLIEVGPTSGAQGQFHTALAWLNALPEEIVRADPALCIYHAGALMYTNHVAEAELRLQDAERCVAGVESTGTVRVVLGQVAAIRAAIARISGDLARCVELANQALGLLPEPEVVPLKLRTVATLSASRGYLVSGDVGEENERIVASAIGPLRAADNRYGSLLSMTNLARLQAMQGRLRQASSTYDETIRMVSQTDEIGGLFGGPTYYFGMGEIEREWNNLTTADTLLFQGMELLQGNLTVDAETILQGHLSRARLQQSLGHVVRAIEILDEFSRQAQQRGFYPPLLARAAAARARISLAQGDIPGAVRWAETSGLCVNDDPVYAHTHELLVLARVLIAQSGGKQVGCRLDDTVGLLDRMLRAASAGGRMGDAIEISVVRALALQAADKSREALLALETALTLAAPEGYVRIFLDEGQPVAILLSGFLKRHRNRAQHEIEWASFRHAQELLQKFGRPPEGETSPKLDATVSRRHGILPEDLTAREQEVLALIATGDSNRAIANRLFIEVSTVKSYVNSIFGKLGAESRTQAVARGRALHLIAD